MTSDDLTASSPLLMAAASVAFGKKRRMRKDPEVRLPNRLLTPHREFLYARRESGQRGWQFNVRHLA
jgi:hypothetical protein